MIFVMGLLLAAQATSVGAPTDAAKKPAADKLICVRVEELGTRLGNHRVCRTKAEWDQDRMDVRNDVEKAQRTNYH